MGNARHQISLSESFVELDKKERNRRCADAGRTYFETYLPAIQWILSTPTVLPHLELLDWEDKITTLPRSFFDDLTRSHIQHLRLYRVRVDEEFTTGSHYRLATPWPLRTLHFEIDPQTKKKWKISMVPLWASLLHLCAPTLESLTWTDYYSCTTGERSPAAAGLNSALSFPCLCNLKIYGVRFTDASMLDALLQCKLQTLHISGPFDPMHQKSFQNRGSIPAFRTF